MYALIKKDGTELRFENYINLQKAFVEEYGSLPSILLDSRKIENGVTYYWGSERSSMCVLVTKNGDEKLFKSFKDLESAFFDEYGYLPRILLNVKKTENGVTYYWGQEPGSARLLEDSARLSVETEETIDQTFLTGSIGGILFTYSKQNSV